MSVVVIGHVDSGKSTTCGHLLCKLGNIPKRELDKLAKEAENNSKASFVFAYVMAKSTAEKKRGITIDSNLK